MAVDRGSGRAVESDKEVEVEVEVARLISLWGLFVRR